MRLAALFFLALAVFGAAAQPLVAVWTGGATQVRSVTGQLVWRCEYTLGYGPKIARLFKDYPCPPEIQVE